MSTSQQAPTSGWRNRRVPLLIVGSFVLVILLSTLLFRAALLGQVDLPGSLGTKNNGVLISPPQRIDELPLRGADGQPFEYGKPTPQWTMLIPVRRDCDDACRQTLYLTRQMHVALGKEASRVRRVVLADGPVDSNFERLLQEHPKLQVLQADTGAQAAFFAKTGLAEPLREHAYFIVDPQGWVMMYYTAQHDGRAVMDDLKFLLKNSHESEGN